MASQGQHEDVKDKGGDSKARRRRPEIALYVPKARLSATNGPETSNGPRNSEERNQRLAAGDSRRRERDRPDSAASFSSRFARSRTNSIASVTSEASEANFASLGRNGRSRNNSSAKVGGDRRRANEQPSSDLFLKSMRSLRISAEEKQPVNDRKPPSERNTSPKPRQANKPPARESPARVFSPKPPKPKLREEKPPRQSPPTRVVSLKTQPSDEKPSPRPSPARVTSPKPKTSDQKPSVQDSVRIDSPKPPQSPRKPPPVEKPVEDKTAPKVDPVVEEEERKAVTEKPKSPSPLKTNISPPSSVEVPNVVTRLAEEYKPMVACWSDEVEEYEKKHPEKFISEPTPRESLERRGPDRGSKKEAPKVPKGSGRRNRRGKEQRHNENRDSDPGSRRQAGVLHVPSSVVKDSGRPGKNALKAQDNSDNRAATRQLFDPRNPDKPLLVRIPNDRARDFSGDKELVRRVVLIDESRSHPPRPSSPQQPANSARGYPPPAASPEAIAAVGFNGQVSTRIDPLVVPTVMRCSSQLEALLQSNNLARDWARISELRTHLFGLYKIVLLGDLKFFEANNMEQMLWKTVFYSVIERLRKAGDVKAVPELHVYKYRELLVEVINQGKAYFTMLLESLESTYKVNLDDYVDSDDGSEGNWARPRPGIVSLALISAQKLCLYMGDLARYKECYCDETPPVPTPDSPALKTARRHYARALELNPKNGRSYNQMAFVSLYNGRKLDAVYYYCRSLMTVNSFQSAKESLLSIFEDTKRKWEEKKRKEAADQGRRRLRSGGSNNQNKKHWKRSRREIWIHPDTGTREERQESVEDLGDSMSVASLEKMPRSQLIKEFSTSFLVVHGMLFTKVNFETFEEAALETLQLFRACVRLDPFPFTLQKLQQFLIMNMFAVEMNSQKACPDNDAHRALIGEHAIMLLLETMSVLLEQACCNLFDILSQNPTGTSSSNPASVQVSALSPNAALKSQDLFTSGVTSFYLPVSKIWCDWLMSHDDVWFPAPPLPLYHVTAKDVWQNWADFLTLLQYHTVSLPSLVEGVESGGAPAGHKAIWLNEDKMIAGFYPMNATHDPVEPIYCEFGELKETAEMAVRMSKIKTCCEFMCGLDPPFIKYSSTANAFVSVVPVKKLSGNDESAPAGTPGSCSSEEDEESERSTASQTSWSNRQGMGKQIRTLLKEREERRKDGEKQSSMHAIFKSVKSGEHERRSEVRVVPKYLVPDTNCLIEDLDGVKRLVAKIGADAYSAAFSVVVPNLVMGELKYISSNKSSQACEAAYAALDFLRRCTRGVSFCTSRGSLLKRFSDMGEDDDSNLNHRLNDEIILTCCRNLESNNPVASNKQGPLERHVVLLTGDRNLRVRGRSQEDDPVPSISLNEFLQWARIFK